MPNQTEIENPSERINFEKFCNIDLENTTLTEISTNYFEQFISSSKKGRLFERDHEILYMLITNQDLPQDYTDQDIYKELFKKVISPEANLSDEETFEYIEDNKDPIIGEPLQDRLTQPLINNLPKMIRASLYHGAKNSEDLRNHLSDFLGSIRIDYEFRLLSSGYPYQELQQVKCYYLKKFSETLHKELNSSEKKKEEYNQNQRVFIRKLINTLQQY